MFKDLISLVGIVVGLVIIYHTYQAYQPYKKSSLSIWDVGYIRKNFIYGFTAFTISALYYTIEWWWIWL